MYPQLAICNALSVSGQRIVGFMRGYSEFVSQSEDRNYMRSSPLLVLNYNHHLASELSDKIILKSTVRDSILQVRPAG